MPILPNVQTLGPRPTPASGYRPASVSGGTAVADATAQLGDTVAKEANAQADKMSLASAQKASAELTKAYSDLLYAPDTGALSQKGENALNVVQNYQARFDEVRQRIGQSLVGKARQAFDLDAQQRQTAFTQALSQHQARETDVHRTTMHTSQMDASQTVMAEALARGDVAAAKAEEQRLFDASSAFHSVNGTSANIPEEMRSATSKAVVAAVSLAVANNDAAAVRSLMGRVGELPPAEQAKVLSAAKPVIDADTAEQVVNGTYVPPSADMPPVARSLFTKSDDDSWLRAVGKLESGNNPNAVNPGTGATGEYQFILSIHPEAANASPEKLRQLALDLREENRNVLRRALGRDPTDAELYLAHQQGGAGAARLLLNPDAKAYIARGRAAITQNGGDMEMTSREFVAMWATRFEKARGADAPQVNSASAPVAPAPTPADVRAMSLADFQQHVASLNLTPEAERLALKQRREQVLAEAKAVEAEAKAAESATYEAIIANGNSVTAAMATPEGRAAFDRFRKANPEAYFKMTGPTEIRTDPSAYRVGLEMVARGEDPRTNPGWNSISLSDQLELLRRESAADGKGSPTAAMVDDVLKNDIVSAALGLRVSAKTNETQAQEIAQKHLLIRSEIATWAERQVAAGQKITEEDVRRYAGALAYNVPLKDRTRFLGNLKFTAPLDTPNADEMRFIVGNRRMSGVEVNAMLAETLTKEGTAPTQSAVEERFRDLVNADKLREDVQ